jgi:hypothetical protein
LGENGNWTELTRPMFPNPIHATWDVIFAIYQYICPVVDVLIAVEIICGVDQDVFRRAESSINTTNYWIGQLTSFRAYKGKIKILNQDRSMMKITTFPLPLLQTRLRCCLLRYRQWFRWRCARVRQEVNRREQNSNGTDGTDKLLLSLIRVLSTDISTPPCTS